jgi:hypothetical protein
LKEENEKLKEFMDNKETLDVFGQLLSGKNMIMLKSRQTGKSSINASLMEWHSLHSKYERVRIRKERIKSIFNI